jgi:UDP-3-O-[3-hydroxymyristoyl] glucosamine N-acyltransferase
MKLKDIAAMVHGSVVGDADVEISRVAKIQDAERGDITFLANPKYEKYLGSTKASAIIVSRDVDEKKLNGNRGELALLKVDDPYLSFLEVMQTLQPTPSLELSGIHPTAVVAPSAILDPGVALGAHVIVGERTRIGRDSKISHGTVIGDDVNIGGEVLIFPNVVIRERCRVGERVIIHAGTVVGSDGFGFVPVADGTYKKVPQSGIVVIEDDVEIGANCTIDRATLGETLIKRGVKLDNLVHVGHNVVIGENTAIAAQTGISGSAQVGRHVRMGGQVGLIGHIEIADDVTIMAGSGVSKSILKPGSTYFGSPAKEQHKAFRIEAALRQLPEVLEELRELQKRIENLEKQLLK